MSRIEGSSATDFLTDLTDVTDRKVRRVLDALRANQPGFLPNLQGKICVFW